MLITRSERSNPNLVARVTWAASVARMPHRKVRNAISKNIRVFRNLATDPQTEKPDHDQIQDLGAAAVLSMMMATPLFAQAAIQEPGAFAFFHPQRGRSEWRPANAGGLRRPGIGSARRQRRVCRHGQQRERLVLRSALSFLRPGFRYLPRHDGHRHPCE